MTSLGHGHVIPNPDGSKARCGGPTICGVCSKEAAQALRDVKAWGDQACVTIAGLQSRLQAESAKVSALADAVERLLSCTTANPRPCSDCKAVARAALAQVQA